MCLTFDKSFLFYGHTDIISYGFLYYSFNIKMYSTQWKVLCVCLCKDLCQLRLLGVIRWQNIFWYRDFTMVFWLHICREEQEQIHIIYAASYIWNVYKFAAKKRTLDVCKRNKQKILCIKWCSEHNQNIFAWKLFLLCIYGLRPL